MTPIEKDAFLAFLEIYYEERFGKIDSEENKERVEKLELFDKTKDASILGDPIFSMISHKGLKHHLMLSRIIKVFQPVANPTHKVKPEIKAATLENGGMAIYP
ncbi:hypothetical protein [Phormidium tenue]|uniref:Uncharacterized protein n=1 Tax=Phormidium tenue FACHB-1050 TaxID=2692857 RepID=A0ABR8C7D7_9CYAN|nr:hypothetical protein [Phormidium tenue]MBD2316684.1 hypothetical protein [Phormidium tenue FACHB-1050]